MKRAGVRWTDFLDCFDLLPRRSTPLRWVWLWTLSAAILAYGIALAASGARIITVLTSFVRVVAGSPDRFFENVVIFGPLVLLAMGVAIAKKVNLWNVGADGQMLAGATAGFAIGQLTAPTIPSFFAFTLAAGASAVCGALLAGFAAWMKLTRKSDEVFLLLMMNFLIVHLVTYLLAGPMQDPLTHWLQSPELFAPLRLSVLPGAGQLTTAIFPVAVVCVVLVLVERYTRCNDALLVAGDSPDALRHQGIAPRPVILKAALASGALCGFAGWIEVAGSQHRIVDNLTPGYGYYALVIALIAGARMGRTVAAALVFAILINGLRGAAREVHVDVYVSDIFLGFAILTHLVVTGLRTHKLVYRPLGTW